jgi:heme/copper-type cytochrome/quinol oxidase subunit 2
MDILIQLAFFLLLAIGMIVWGVMILRKNKVNPGEQHNTSGRRIGGLILISLGIVAIPILIFLFYFIFSTAGKGIGTPGSGAFN